MSIPPCRLQEKIDFAKSPRANFLAKNCENKLILPNPPGEQRRNGCSRFVPQIFFGKHKTLTSLRQNAACIQMGVDIVCAGDYVGGVEGKQTLITNEEKMQMQNLHAVSEPQMKTYQDLGIQSEEKAALIWVRDGLRNGFFKRVDEGSYPSCNSFNMGLTHKAYECGSIACIGGWVWVALNHEDVKQEGDVFKMTSRQAYKADEYVYSANSVDGNGDDDGRLHDLFFPPNRYNYNRIKEEQAAIAIDNFLETGEAKWEKILG